MALVDWLPKSVSSLQEYDIALLGGSKTQVSGPPNIQAALARAGQLYDRRKQKRTEEEY